MINRCCNLKRIIGGLSVITLLLACKQTVDAKQSMSVPFEWCYRNDFSQGKTNSKDYVELKLKGDTGKVIGSYDWVPLEKDSRKGKIYGYYKGNRIKATYAFIQEGIRDTMELEIILKHDRAEVKELRYGFGKTAISKVSCTDD